MFRAGIITVSDKGAAGLREDKSGLEIKKILTEAGIQVAYQQLVADEQKQIEKLLIEACDNGVCDLLLTTGGTGLSKRDVTPEATKAIAEKEVPGISEAMRAYSMKITPRGMLSRGVSVIRKNTLIINLPGSVKAVRENLEAILPALDHGLKILTNQESECGAP